MKNGNLIFFVSAFLVPSVYLAFSDKPPFAPTLQPIEGGVTDSFQQAVGEAVADTQKPFVPAFTYTHLVESRPDEVVFCGPDLNRIMVLTEKGTVLHSADFGKTWQSMAENFNVRNSRLDAKIISMLHSHLDPQVIVFIERNREHLITTDCGESFRTLGQRLGGLSFHPRNAGTLAGIDAAGSLWLSEDNGGMWRALLPNVREFSFTKPTSDNYFASTSRMFAVVRSVSRRNQSSQRLVYSDDYFATTTRLVEDVEVFRLTRCCVYSRAAGDEMRVADAYGHFHHFYSLKVEGLDERNFSEFNVIEADELFSTFGSVSYSRDSLELHRLVKSDEFGADFRILAEDLVCDRAVGFCDFLPLRSLVGSVLVNRYNKSFLDLANSLPPSRRAQLGALTNYNTLADYRSTHVSFDFGETFSRLPAPATDHRGQPIACEDACYLNLHLQSAARNFALPRTSPSAPGLIIASGSVSAFLVEREDDPYLGVFLSRDGGFTWTMIAQGRHSFALLDHGNVIVLAARSLPTAELTYSLDAGVTWRQLAFADAPLSVIGLTVKDKVALKKLLIATRAPEGYGSKAQITTVDFSNLFERTCDSDQDYEHWTPATNAPGQCLQGARVAYLRKRPDRACFNPAIPVFVSEYNACECTEADFHCDFGFARDENGQCVRDSQFEVDTEAPPGVCIDDYVISSGYRKNYQTACEGGVEHPPVVLPCPQTRRGRMRSAYSFGKRAAWLFAFALVLWKGMTALSIGHRLKTKIDCLKARRAGGYGLVATASEKIRLDQSSSGEAPSLFDDSEISIKVA